MTGDSVPRRLVNLVRSIQDECWPLAENQAPTYVPPGFLFRDAVHVHSIPFFGDLPRASVITVAVNPSSTEFVPWRKWGSERLSASALTSRLLGYFKSTEPKPHPWFAEVEEALNILGLSYTNGAAHLDLSPRATRSMMSFQMPNERRAFLGMLKHDLKWLVQTFAFIQKPKLVILLGKVIDEHNTHGLGLGEFLSTHAPDDFWNHTLAGRRWPQNPCSKSQLAYRVFRNRNTLLDFLHRN